MNKKKLLKIALVTAAALAVIAALTVTYIICFSKPKTISPKETVFLSEMTDETDGIKLIAHRGLSGIAPENTLPAFTEAGKAGYYGTECDVRMTKDGKWVIMHDFDTKRICLSFKAISSSTLDELKELTVKNGANIKKYENTKIPTVEEYLETCVKYSLVPVIEIKNSDCSLMTMQSLCDTVYSVEGVRDVIFISFTKQAIENIKKINKDNVCYLLVNEMKTENIDYCKDNDFGIDFNANNKKLTDETLEYAAKSGIVLSCWTVDQKETLERMLGFGIDIFTTNRILPEE